MISQFVDLKKPLLKPNSGDASNDEMRKHYGVCAKPDCLNVRSYHSEFCIKHRQR